MTLDAEDIAAIASAVVAQLRAADSRQKDQAYLASLPLAEQKRIAREQRRAEVAAIKSQGGAK